MDVEDAAGRCCTDDGSLDAPAAHYVKQICRTKLEIVLNSFRSQNLTFLKVRDILKL